MLGDLLISDSAKPDQFIIPTLSEDVIQYLSEDSQFHPITMNQKIYILKENVCIAFAGVVFKFRKFLEDIRIFCKVEPILDAETIQQFLKEHESDPNWADFTFIILVANKTDSNIIVGRALHGTWNRSQTLIFDEVWAAGSGAEDFLKEMSQKANAFSTHSIDDPSHALLMNIIMISKLLAAERAMLSSVKKHWGAGFEMLYYNGNKFVKVDDITYVLNQGIFHESGDMDVPVPEIILRYKYHGEVLVITCIRTLGGRTETTDSNYVITCNSYNVRPFIVLPIDHFETDSLENLTRDLSFVTNNVAMGYILETETGYYLPASVHLGPELSVNFQQSGTLTITMKKEVNDRIVEEARNTLTKDT